MIPSNEAGSMVDELLKRQVEIGEASPAVLEGEGLTDAQERRLRDDIRRFAINAPRTEATKRLLPDEARGWEAWNISERPESDHFSAAEVSAIEENVISRAKTAITRQDMDAYDQQEQRVEELGNQLFQRFRAFRPDLSGYDYETAKSAAMHIAQRDYVSQGYDPIKALQNEDQAAYFMTSVAEELEWNGPTYQQLAANAKEPSFFEGSPEESHGHELGAFDDSAQWEEPDDGLIGDFKRIEIRRSLGLPGGAVEATEEVYRRTNGQMNSERELLERINRLVDRVQR
jgi:hypothetical protein